MFIWLLKFTHSILTMLAISSGGKITHELYSFEVLVLDIYTPLQFKGKYYTF